ncbi:MAG: hypothetical protein EA378_08480 [Phycisphaerales bacterium]|nr:MAG: hypothetical protein EA378_08480 [Phycisphaerales bacterium]
MALAGLATAQPTLNGQLTGDEAAYGPALWTNTTPTLFGDAQPSDPCEEDGSFIADAPNVNTGFEAAIPLSVIGNPTGPIRLKVMLMSDSFDFISNQVSGDLGGITAPNVGDPRGADFNNISGIQYVTVTHNATFQPSIDGVNDGAGAYGDSLYDQQQATTFGDNENPSPGFGLGAEIDNIYASTDGSNLFIFVGGNLSDNFSNRLVIFIDTDSATGQNQLRGDNADISFDRLNRMGNSEEGVTTDGLVFDAGFSADYVYTVVLGGGDPGDPEDPFSEVFPSMFVDFAELPTTGGGAGTFVGDGIIGLGFFAVSSNQGEFGYDNSNVGGVLAVCPPPAGNPDVSTGSELNQLFGYIDEDTGLMYLLLTGNLETNGNVLNLFFDVAPGGQGATFPLSGQNVDVDFNGLNRMGDGEVGNPPVFTDGVILEHDANFWLSFKTFNPANPEYFVNAAVLRTQGFPLSNSFGAPFDFGAFYGGVKATIEARPDFPFINFDGPRVDDEQDDISAIPAIFTQYGPRTTTNNVYGPLFDPFNFPSPLPPVPGLINAALDNSNLLGVTDTDGSDAASATTGMEFVLDMNELGWDGTSPVRVMGWIASQDYGFISNQVIGGLPTDFDTMNVGEVRGTNFQNIPGDQFVTIPVRTGDVNTCPFDITGPALDGVPDGVVSIADLNFYIGLWLDNDIAADFTGPALDGIPDGAVTIADLNFYLSGWLDTQGACP